MSNKKKDEEENILGVNSPLPGEEHETEEDWAKDEDVQAFLEWADEPGPWDEQYDKSYTVGGLSADKDKSFIEFQKKMDRNEKKMREQEDFYGPNKSNGV